MTYAIQEWTELRERYFADRYALHDSEGTHLEIFPQQMWDRVARSLARTLLEKQQFYWALQDFRFVPGGRILSGVGAGQKVTYYNCFVIGVGEAGSPDGRDSRRGVLYTTSQMIEITARGGGVGVNWATLRPAGTYIRGVNSTSSGSVMWMSGVDHMVDKVRQGGTRTAALMYILPDWHPDVMQFIDHSFLRANHSVAISDEFMRAVERDDLWAFKFPDPTDPRYDQQWNGDLDAWGDQGGPIKIHSMVPARDIWDRMAQQAAATGNPGCLWMTRAQQRSNTRYFEQYTSTNPCGEQWLPENGCCNLGSINLVAFWNPTKKDLNWSELGECVGFSVRMLDRIIDRSPDLDKAIGDLQRNVRRVGLGTMGLADVLILKGLRYGSQESLDWIHTIYSFIRDSAYWYSMRLAMEFGTANAFTSEFLQGKFIQDLPKYLQAEISAHGIRNLTLTNQAPTGTTSILAGVSSGIEPIFRSSYTLNDNATGRGAIRVLHPLWQDEVTEAHVTADMVTPAEHIAVQAAVQQYLDNAVSKTINMPEGTTWQQVQQAYQLAYDQGCKGVTVYVDNSRVGGLFTTEAAPVESVADELGFDANCATGVCSA